MGWLTKGSIRPIHIARWGGQIALFLILLWGAEWWLSREVVRGEMPAFVATTIEGEQFNSREFAEQPWLLHLWASWCPVCELEHASMESLAVDVPLMSIAMSSGSLNEVASYMAEEQLSYAVINDPEAALSRALGVFSVPVTLVVDGHNQIRFVTRGYTSEWGLRGRLWLASWLQD
ncbi:protein disulfide oxidoreductase [Ectothiorhodospiraceae bacterium BW-2]|nr:protein disulfide oxidoreductase [Ectothiorhodospiraceae bacterium BW-2]